MTTLVKISIGAVAVGLLYSLFKKGTQLANSFGFQINGYDSPSVNYPNLDLPVRVQFTNPTPLPITIDNITGAIYIDKNGWVNVANFSQPMTIPPGTNEVKIQTRIDLGKIIGGNILDTLKSALTTYATKSLSVRTDITVTKAGITFPTQQFVNKIQVG